MAGLEQLAVNIYHEKQEHGSALCAQHALNSLLQGSYFTPSDLSTIAHTLDSLEQDVDQGRLGRASANMDDTGFFSIQVLENALNVWGQSLIRWRSEAMQSHQDRPQDQRAFILNCDQHWFTLRRFGNSEGSGPWFNLDSSLDRPKWISETYLGIWLQQAEADGYSTFVVVPTNPDNPLPQTDADVIAVSFPPRASSEAQHSSNPYYPHSSAGFEDEDFGLQAALQASIDGAAVQIPMPQPRVGPVAGGTRAISPAPGPNIGPNIGFPTSPPLSPPPPVPHPSTRPVNQPMANPVAASMARNQVVLERMRREQEAALREHYHDEISRFGQMSPGNISRSGIGSQHHEEEEQIRRAIAESEEMAREQGLGELGLGRAQTGSDDGGTRARSDNTQQAEASRHDRIHGGRVYDDEDAEFQAALQASLETAPPGIHTPTPPRAFDSPMRQPSNNTNVHDNGDDDDDDDLYFDEEDTATEETLSDSAEPQQADDVNMEEMRRRRLARFGA
ncbi:Josephin-domain-containing protein [Russula emetica]|nr:Josephin-domain-containing protein [Russula emetica]